MVSRQAMPDLKGFWHAESSGARMLRSAFSMPGRSVDVESSGHFIMAVQGDVLIYSEDRPHTSEPTQRESSSLDPWIVLPLH
jgi:hypothetical protein